MNYTTRSTCSLTACGLIALLLALPSRGGAEGVLYKCLGEDGVPSYQQAPCATQQAKAGQIHYTPAPAAPYSPTVPTAPPATPPSSAPAATAPAASVPATMPPANDRLSDVFECIRDDGRTYLRRGACESHLRAGIAIHGQSIDPATGEARPFQGQSAPIEVQDDGRRLMVSVVCAAAKRDLERMRADFSRTMDRLRHVEAIRDMYCP